MNELTKPTITVSVRDLVEFVLRRGDLAGRGDFVSSTRLLEGTWGHQRVQRGRPSGYQIEVSVTHRLETENFILIIRGRIDGLMEQGTDLLIEEIKTVLASWDGLAQPLHWAQGKIYAHLFARTRPTQSWRKIDVQLTYLELESDHLSCFRESYSASDLEDFFESVLKDYLEWVRQEVAWRKTRDASIAALSFPYELHRPGQLDLSQAVQATLLKGERLFIEAPTGLGKTMAVLYPAVRVLGQGRLERLFFLTAKTVGRMAAENACGELRRAGLRWRSVTLTAREKVCVRDGQPCDVRTCPLAVGYYDRWHQAMREALTQETLARTALEEVAVRHQVCPYQLAMDCAAWADLIIADYNYVFDPRVYLRRFFAEPGGPYAFLVDEAHNLVERAREMFSADLRASEVTQLRRALRDRLPRCARLLDRVYQQLCACAAAAEEELEGRPQVTRTVPAALLEALRDFGQEAERWLARNEESDFRDGLLQFFFRSLAFQRTSEGFDECYVTLAETQRGETRVRLLCLDPSVLLREGLDRGQAAIFFSGTLSPLEYFRNVLGGRVGDGTLQLASPFPSENLEVLVCAQISTEFRSRHATHDAIAQKITALVTDKPGNYLVYFPSYDYLNEVRRRFEAICAVRTHVQRSGMSESERAQFLEAFRPNNTETLVGFAVLGGIFGEGIDLVGDRLVGVAVVGVGLPQVSVERELIRHYYQEKLEAGFAYAYLFPGMNRVLQAAGRVIRSELDRGVVLLIDRRFREERYRQLLPSWWHWRWEGHKEQGRPGLPGVGE